MPVSLRLSWLAMKASYIYIFIVKQQLNLLLSSRPEGEILYHGSSRSLPQVEMTVIKMILRTNVFKLGWILWLIRKVFAVIPTGHPRHFCIFLAGTSVGTSFSGNLWLVGSDITGIVLTDRWIPTKLVLARFERGNMSEWRALLLNLQALTSDPPFFISYFLHSQIDFSTSRNSQVRKSE